MADSWFAQIEPTVFTQVQYMLKKKYGALECKTTSETITPAYFPTLYLHETQAETGQDLLNEDVTAVNSTIYVRVWANDEQECRKILTDATLELKRFHYNVMNLPTTTLSNKIAFGEIMCRRIIGGGDSDIVK